PMSRRWALSCLRVTPGSTTASKSSALTVTMRFMRVRSSDMPPFSGMVCPSIDDPAPNGVTGTPCSKQAATTRCTSASLSAWTTACGRRVGWRDMSCPWCCRTASATESRSPKCGLSASITAETFVMSCPCRGAMIARALDFLRRDELEKHGNACLGLLYAAADRRHDFLRRRHALAIGAERAGKGRVVAGNVGRPVLLRRNRHDRQLHRHGEVVEQDRQDGDALA